MFPSEWIVPDWPAPPRVAALVTTRSPGVSVGPYASFNLAAHVGDDPEAVRENRRRLRRHLPAEPFWLDQVHGARCVCADAPGSAEAADAAFARTPGTVCAVMTADCLPVLLCDERASVVAAVHCGWRGLAAGVIRAAVAHLGAPPQSLLAWLGPAIGPESYEVGGEVRDAFLAHGGEAADAFRPARTGRWRADLYALARQHLAAAGVARIYGGGFDTCSEPERFFSHRRSGVTGRMAALIWLRGAGARRV